jgi:hypothetical protein
MKRRKTSKEVKIYLLFYCCTKRKELRSRPCVGGMAQVAQSLPSKHKALSQTTVPPKKKKKEVSRLGFQT